ncbi:DMT family transporter [Clostridium manihotivorum]|uniref:EamA family transporter n=1 Tax=Clostridium manihotivorum TaxID=2320868 RepID=A0A410DRQ0_9CLOT|nr:DMT family transporter [Clostridium manihotivorum]QAA31784.1 EamA family transporter [Clostridium manihotivorum]
MKLGYITSILSAVLFGLAGVLIKLIFSYNIDSIDLIILQYAFIIAILFVVLAVFNINILKVGKRDFFRLIILGIVGDCFMTVFYYKSFYYLPVGIATVLLYTSPIFIYLYSIFFEHKKFTIKSFSLLIVIFIGCSMVIGILPFSYSPIGILYGVLGAAAFGFMNVYSSKKLENINAMSLTFYSMLFSLIFLCIYRLPSKGIDLNLPIKAYIFIVLLAFLCAFLPLMLFYYSIKKIGSFNTSVIGNLEVPTAIIAGLLIFGERMNLIQLFGILIILFGVYNIEKSNDM